MTAMKIGIVHYRAGRTDGVSLEVAKRQRVLESLGHEVNIIAGAFNRDTDCLIPELHVYHPEVITIRQNAWAHFNYKTLDSDEIIRRVYKLSDTIKQTFNNYHQQEKFDLLLIHNIFSYSLHLPAAKAFAEVITDNNLPAIATNHDYYWERAEYSKTTGQHIDDFLDKYIPFDHPRIHYVSINSTAQSELVRRRSINSDLMGDVLDFERPHWDQDIYNGSLLHDIGVKPNDLYILQATRIVKRKGIEMAIDLVAELTRRKKELVGETLYNGKIITQDSDIVLVLSGFTEHIDENYQAKLQDKISSPKFRQDKTYLVQVENLPDETALEKLRTGMKLKDGLSLPAKVKIISEPELWPRNPPIRERKNIPTTWLELSIREGRNRQVRRMTAAIGHPTLRLIRTAVADWQLNGLAPGKWQQVSE